MNNTRRAVHPKDTVDDRTTQKPEEISSRSRKLRVRAYVRAVARAAAADDVASRDRTTASRHQTRLDTLEQYGLHLVRRGTMVRGDVLEVLDRRRSEYADRVRRARAANGAAAKTVDAQLEQVDESTPEGVREARRLERALKALRPALPPPLAKTMPHEPAYVPVVQAPPVVRGTWSTRRAKRQAETRKRNEDRRVQKMSEYRQPRRSPADDGVEAAEARSAARAATMG